MARFYAILPNKWGDPGGGPDDDRREKGRNDAMISFVGLIFGIALGLTLAVFYLLITLDILSTSLIRGLSFSWIELGSTFLGGLIFGVLFSIIYNLLSTRRFNIFGSDTPFD